MAKNKVPGIVKDPKVINEAAQLSLKTLSNMAGTLGKQAVAVATVIDKYNAGKMKSEAALVAVAKAVDRTLTPATEKPAKTPKTTKVKAVKADKKADKVAKKGEKKAAKAEKKLGKKEVKKMSKTEKAASKLNGVGKKHAAAAATVA